MHGGVCDIAVPKAEHMTRFMGNRVLQVDGSIVAGLVTTPEFANAAVEGHVDVEDLARVLVVPQECDGECEAAAIDVLE